MISFIIPAYNAGKTITRCLTSIINQTYSKYEIIIINDGSSDNTLDLLESIHEIYECIDIKIYSTINQGHSKARNLGISKAKYKYLWFVDADDMLYNEKVLEDAIVDLDNNDPDVYIFSVLQQEENHKEIIWNFTKNDKAIFLKDYPSLILKQNWVWNKIMKKSFVEENILHFKGYKMFEDNYFMADLYLKNPKLYLTNDIKYVYIKHPDALTSSFKNFRTYPKSFVYLLKTYLRALFLK